MKVRFVDEAQREFLEAISEYEEARAGLGGRFKDEVDRCALWIADHPESSCVTDLALTDIARQNELHYLACR